MRWTPERARQRFAESRVARLATADRDGKPHIVPITFAVYGDTIATAVDAKPKSTHRLKRLANIEANPQVALLADEYDDDWKNLWWARADGTARILDAGGERRTAVGYLAQRYTHYYNEPPHGPVILIVVHHWTGWSFA